MDLREETSPLSMYRMFLPNWKKWRREIKKRPTTNTLDSESEIQIMMGNDYSLKTMMEKPERLSPGHRMCAGCGATIGVRAVLRALHEEDHAVIGNATLYPQRV